MTKYTAADFANAKFAEHPNPEDVDARYAARMNTDPTYPWLLDGVPGNTDEAMSRTGWVPVPTKPTITKSGYRLSVDDRHPQYVYGFIDAMNKFGIEVTPDPEPTNTELIADALIDGFEKGEFTLESSFRDIATALIVRGITPPNMKDN